MRISPKTAAGRRRAGFTMIELLAVIIILTILMAYLVPKLVGSEESVARNKTRMFLAQIDTSLAEFEVEWGDYPSSTFTPEQGAPPNSTNVGGEALYLNLWREGSDGLGIDPDQYLANSDADSVRKKLTTLASRELFELRDHWDNPIAYFHRRDYGRQDTYLTFDPGTGEEIPDNKVMARVSEKTGRAYNYQKYQLISAGPDGRFGGEDDIVNFKTD